MARKKKPGAVRQPQRADGPRERPPLPFPPTLSRGRLWAALGVVGTVLVAGVLVVARRGGDDATSQGPLEPLPPPRVTFVAAPIAQSDFVGSEACASCHPSEFAAWSRSTHAAAGGPPGRVRVIAPFDGTPIRFEDALVVPERRGGTWRFVVRQAGKPEQVLVVDGVVGGGHMQGGGTQGFVSRQPDGTLRFLPFDFIRAEGTWFCNTNSRAGRGWVPITPQLRLADCGDWPPLRVFGDELRFTNCQSCHGSQVDVSSDTVAHAYRTRYTSLNINCESCHGPGRLHLQRVKDAAAVAAGDIGMTPLAAQRKDESLGTCFQCHALKDQLRPGYRPGEALEAYYALRFPQLGDAPHEPDGRVRTFAYQQGHLASDCYVNGGMTCTSCHDPHSQGYRDAQGRPLPGRVDDRQCTSCHASKATAPERHTRHAAGSAGSRCVACHMPYLQEPEVGTALRYARSDHAIPVPRPVADSALGVRSACRGCHADKSETALDQQVLAWYGALKPVAPAVASVVAGKRESDPGRAAVLLLLPDAPHVSALFAGLAAYAEQHLAADGPLPAEAADRLQRLAQHADLDVQGLALAALHYARGRVPSMRTFLAQRLATLGDREPLVRSRWATALGWFADRQRERADPAGAAATYRKALEVDPGSARLQLNLGLALADDGRVQEAISAYRASLAVDALQPLGWVNLGIALAGSGNRPGAETAYRRALAINLREPLAHFNLANLYLEAGMLDSAAASYRRVVAADPSVSLAHFYLARILAQRGDVRGALAEVEAGLEFDPGSDEGRSMRAQLGRVTGAGPGDVR